MNIKKLVITVSFWVTACSLPISIIAIIKSYHEYYIFHSEQYREAMKYMETTACTDSGVRASLGTFNLCPESEERIRISPALRSFYDLTEDLSICGRGRCWATLQLFTQSMPWFIVCVFIVSALLFYFISERRYKDSVVYWSLPTETKGGKKPLKIKDN